MRVVAAVHSTAGRDLTGGGAEIFCGIPQDYPQDLLLSFLDR